MRKTRELTMGGILIGLGLVLPYVFHKIPGNLGRVLLPMHIPVLIGGFILSPVNSLLVGVVTPLLNSWITGMPPIFPVAIRMAFELGVYGLMSSILYRKLKLSIFPSLLITLILGRVVAGVFNYGFAYAFNMDLVSPIVWVIGTISTGAIGIVIQLVLIPTVVKFIEKKYNKERI